MNKQLNTAIFMIAGTLFSILTTGLVFFGILAGLMLAFGSALSPGIFAGITLAAFSVAIIVSLFAYRALVVFLMDKFKLHDKIIVSVLPRKKPRS